MALLYGLTSPLDVTAEAFYMNETMPDGATPPPQGGVEEGSWERWKCFHSRCRYACFQETWRTLQ